MIFEDTKKELSDFLNRYVAIVGDVESFIEKCYKRNKTRKSLLRTSWLAGIADQMEKIEPGCPALRVVFLVILAETITKLLFRKSSRNVGPRKRFKTFFEAASDEEKALLLCGIQKYDGTSRKFRFNTLLDIIYNLRNEVFHEGRYFNFFFHEAQRQGTIVPGYTGTKASRLRKVSLYMTLSYENFRDVFVKTALRNIGKVVN